MRALLIGLAVLGGAWLYWQRFRPGPRSTGGEAPRRPQTVEEVDSARAAMPFSGSSFAPPPDYSGLVWKGAPV